MTRASRIAHAVKREKEHLAANTDWDDESGPPDDDDAMDSIESQCGRMPRKLGGGCSLAGTEFCDWECPFS